MKKLLSIALCATAAAAFADEIPLGEVGVTRIAAQANTIIAVSYQDLASGDVAISNLVKTTNLAVGDQMAVFNDGVYETWTLAEGTGGAKYWDKNEKQYTLDGDGNLVEVEAKPASIVTKSVGTGLWIIQKSNPIQDVVYLYGKPSAVATSTTVAGKWTLIGNPLQVAATPVITDVDATDQIVTVNSDGTLKYFNYKAGKGWRDGAKNQMPAFQPGIGCWVRSTAAKTVTWTAKVSD